LVRRPQTKKGQTVNVAKEIHKGALKKKAGRIICEWGSQGVLGKDPKESVKEPGLNAHKQSNELQEELPRNSLVA